jgi:Uma2 family endonuclease
MTVATDRRMTLEQFLTYDDGTETRYELVDGVLVEMGNESTINTRIAVFLIRIFFGLGFEDSDIGIKQKIAVQSRYVTARDPDLIIHSEESAIAINERAEACLKLDEPNPLLVIEVASPGDETSENYKRDYQEKPKEYAARGIREYWILDPDRKIVLVGTLVGTTYQYKRYQDDEAIGSPTFPGLTLIVSRIWKAGRK